MQRDRQVWQSGNDDCIAAQAGDPVGNVEKAATIDSATTTDGGATWQAMLVHWIASLYEPGAVGEGGMIKGRVPWAARSSWLESDKAEARRVCCELRPRLIEPAAGGRWRLRVEMFATADEALQVLSQRLS